MKTGTDQKDINSSFVYGYFLLSWVKLNFLTDMDNQTSSPESTKQVLDSTLGQSETPKRPMFLTVICILSFIGLGWSILSGIMGLILGKFTSSFYSMYQGMMEKSMNNMGNMPPEASARIESIMNSSLKFAQHAPVINSVNLICSLIALAGVILMWNLKKTGFILYVIPEVIIVFFPLILVGFNFISAMMLVWGIIISGAFIIMYAVNLKAMK